MPFDFACAPGAPVKFPPRHRRVEVEHAERILAERFVHGLQFGPSASWLNRFAESLRQTPPTETNVMRLRKGIPLSTR